MSNPDLSLAIYVDRFVSASSADDARNSLEEMIDGLQQPHFPEDDEEPLWHNRELLEALLHLLSTGQHKNLPLDDEGPSLVLRFYKALVPNQKTTASSSIMVSLLNEPSPGRLVQCVLDVICDSQATAYTRVLALQLMQQCGTHAPSLTQSQLLEAPNGLHLLADVLRDENVPEQVRNEWILVAQKTIAQWPSCAKVWMFAELADTLLMLVKREGGLEGGNVVVLDALQLLETLVSSDGSLADLLWQSPVVAPQLAALLDLRQGTEFRNPIAVSTKSAAVATNSNADDKDDLDAILASGSTKSENMDDASVVFPHLTSNEEKVLRKVTNIIGLLLPNVETKSAVWRQHSPLGSLLWELALVMPPPPDAKPVCTLPSPALQQSALESIALHWNDAATMERHNGLDRLLYLVCTGGGSGTWDEQVGLSQAALHVLRRTLSAETASEVVMHTLAPPMEGEPTPTVLQKLLNTVIENVNLTSDANDADAKRRRMFLLGSLGAIGILVDSSSTSREILLRITSSTNLVESLLLFVEQSQDEVACLAVLRFLAGWMVETPSVVQAVLASHSSSTTFSALWASSIAAVSTLTGFVLGLAMEYMDGEQEEAYGGWTRQSILGLISKRGISQYTSGLEQLEKMQVPWRVCQLEWIVFWDWYMTQVRVIRRRVVKELTSGPEEAEEVSDDDDAEGDDSARLKSSRANIRTLNRLVTQQAQELDEVRSSLAESESALVSCRHERDVWKRRVESNPTQLDEMLTDLSRTNNEHESTILSLTNKLRQAEVQNELMMKEHSETYEKLKQETRDWQEREREAREERETLRSEMEGLSAAYAALETEFNRQAAAAPTSEESDARPAQQLEGEASQQNQVSSGDLDALRSENSRLRSDARAADDWMAMAVQRMNEMGGQNAALEQEVATLNQQLLMAQSPDASQSHTGSSVPETAQMQVSADQKLEHRLRDLERQKSILEKELSMVKREQVDSKEAMEEKLGVERRLRDEMAKQLEHARSDVKTAMDSLGTAKSNREEVERSLGNVKLDLSDARAEIISLTEDKRKKESDRIISLEVELVDTKREIEALQRSSASEIESLKASILLKDKELESLHTGHTTELMDSQQDLAKTRQELDTKSIEADSLRSRVETLQQELEAVKSDFENATKQHWVDMRARDATIIELQTSKQSQGAVSHQYVGAVPTGGDATSIDAADFFGSKGDNSSPDPRDNELARLRSDNDAAQEWMAKAVEHHEMLSEQVAALAADKAALADEVANIRNSKMSSDNETDALLSKIKALETALESVESRLSRALQEKEEINSRYSELQSDVHDKDGAMADRNIAEQEFVGRIQLLESNLQEARSSFVESEETIKRQLSDMDALRASAAQSDEQVQSLRIDLERSTQALSEAESSQLSSQKTLESAMLELKSVQAKKAALNEQCASQAETIEELNGRIEESAACEEKSRRQIDSLIAEKSSIEAQRSEHLVALEATKGDLEAKIVELGDERQKNELTRNNLVVRAEKAESDSDSLREQIAGLRGDLQKLQTEIDSIISSQPDAKQLEEELSISRDALNTAESEIGDLRADLEEVQTQSEEIVRQWSERASDLESTIDELQAALQSQQAEASDAISQWSARCTDIETRAVKLQAELNAAVDEKESLSSNLRGMTDVDEALKREIDKKQDALLKAEQLLEEERLLKQSLEDELTSEIKKLKLDVISAEDRYGDVARDLEDIVARCTSSEEALTARESELRSVINGLETSLQEAHDVSTDAIEQWESQYRVLEQKHTELEKELRTALDTRDEPSISQRLEQDLREDVERGKAENAMLQVNLTLLSDQLEDVREQSEVVVSEWQERVTELEATVDELEEILELQRKQAMDAISQWESRCSALEAKAATLQDELETSKMDFISSLQGVLESKESLLVSSDKPVSRRNSEVSLADGNSPSEVIASLKEQLKEADEVLADAVTSLVTERSSWRAGYEELEQRRQQVVDLQEQLTTAKSLGGDGASPRIETLEELVAEERERVVDLNALLEQEREVTATLEQELLLTREQSQGAANISTECNAREKAETELAETRSNLQSVEMELSTLKQQLRNSQLERGRLDETLEAERVQEKDTESHLKHERDSLVEEKIVLLQERDDLKANVLDLEEELREANDTLQACVTDEASEKAAENVTSALRRQVERLQSQLQVDREILGTEKEGRQAAESEIERIKSDLALVLRTDDVSEDLKRLALKVSNEVQTLERQEIGDLRKALERALQELESARATEHSAVERAEAARLQASVSEQELGSVRSDLTFLSQTMEEIREAEATRKAALEYRISALEDDRELLRRLHADELENMRNELAHVGMEKDRILHSLKESEKKNVALVYSTTKDHRDDTASGASTDAELARLRLERTELLTAIAEEGSRAERRIREAVSARASSMEADVILERELRVSAEAAVEDLKTQVQQLEQEASQVREMHIGSLATPESESTKFVSEKLSSDLSRYQEETKKLAAENSSLRNRLDKAQSESKVHIAELTEKLRTVQAKAHRLERQGHFAAEVQTEVTKIRNDPIHGDVRQDWYLTTTRDGAAEEGPEGSTPADAFDYIQQQKIAIQEERAMYLELLAEHDDLLALLAQQDLEKSALGLALTRAAGNDAVEAAIQEAEEKAVKQFGKYVRLAAASD